MTRAAMPPMLWLWPAPTNSTEAIDFAEQLVTCAFCSAYNGEECEIHDPPMPKHRAGSCEEWEPNPDTEFE